MKEFSIYQNYLCVYNKLLNETSVVYFTCNASSSPTSDYMTPHSNNPEQLSLKHIGTSQYKKLGD